MTEVTDEPSSDATQAEISRSERFGGVLGSQHEGADDERPELQQGASGSGPRPQKPPAAVGGQLGSVGSHPPTAGAPPLDQSKRKQGCFGLLMAVVGVAISIAAALAVL